MNPLSMALSGGVLGAGLGILCGCSDRAVKYGLIGAVAGAIVGKLASKSDAPSQYAAGLQCPEGWDLVATDHQIACAYRKKAACLSGFQADTGAFHCSDWDFPSCPPGTETHPDGPRNWCFPTAAGSHAAGVEARIDETPHGAIGEAFWMPDEMASASFPNEFASFMAAVHDRAAHR